MAEAANESGSSHGGFFHSLIHRWGHSVQTVSAIAVVIVAVMAINIDRRLDAARVEREDENRKAQERRDEEIKKQEERDRNEESRRAAIDRSIALYNFFMTSENTKELMKYHVDIQRKHRNAMNDVSNPTREQSRESMRNAIIASISTGDRQEEVYRMLALALNDLNPIIRCVNFKRKFWNDGQFPAKDEYAEKDGNDPPLCDRETFRTILLGPVSELFFSFRFFFYCENSLYMTYKPTLEDFEVMLADYIYHDTLAMHPNTPSYVFETDEEKDRVMKEHKIDKRMEELYPILRPKQDSKSCEAYLNAFQSRDSSDGGQGDA